MKKQRFIILLIALPLILFVIFEIKFIYDYNFQRRDPSKYILPTQYTGWVFIETNNPNCPKIQKEQNYYIFPINQNGYFCTSSKRKSGWGNDIYIYGDKPHQNLIADPQLGKNKIWNELFVSSTKEINEKPWHPEYYLFYVNGKQHSKRQMTNIRSFLKDFFARIKQSQEKQAKNNFLQLKKNPDFKDSLNKFKD